jgi:chromosome partitioning protein
MVAEPRIVAVANEKGGVGKTVTVINLAAALSREGRRVLVVDMDPQFNATRGLGVEVDGDMPTVYDLVKTRNPARAREAICNTAWQGLDLIPSHIDLAGAEVELVARIGRENRLKSALREVTADYDFVLLDTPPSLSLLTINVFSYACEVLVPCQTHPYAFGALEDLFDTIEAVQTEINPLLKVSAVVATFFDRRTRISNEILAQLRLHERYGPLLCKTVIRTNTTIAESAAEGRPVIFYRSGSYGARDYGRLADEVLAQGDAISA